MNKPAVAIIAGMLLILGIIHLGMGAGLVGAYRQYGDVFRLTIGLSSYNIVIGILAIGLSIFSFVCMQVEREAFSKIAAVTGVVLCVFTLASFITAMALISYSASFARDRLVFKMATFNQNSQSFETMSRVQSDFRCCGVNLWLDWARYPLNLGNGRRRRLSSSSSSSLSSSSVLAESLRQRKRRQDPGFNFPSTFVVYLPLSCCTAGGVSSGNAIGGTCLYNATTGTSGINVDGCLTIIANRSASQLSGYVLVNTLLSIISLLLTAILFALFEQHKDPNAKQQLQGQYQVQQGFEQYQPQQGFEEYPPQQVFDQYQQPMADGYQDGGYIVSYPDPNAAYNYSVPPVYTVYA